MSLGPCFTSCYQPRIVTTLPAKWFSHSLNVVGYGCLVALTAHWVFKMSQGKRSSTTWLLGLRALVALLMGTLSCLVCISVTAKVEKVCFSQLSSMHILGVLGSLSPDIFFLCLSPTTVQTYKIFLQPRDALLRRYTFVWDRLLTHNCGRWRPDNAYYAVFTRNIIPQN